MNFDSQESFDKLLETMIDYKVFTFGITQNGSKGYDDTDEFRKHLLKCINTARSINYNKGERELFISALMTFNKIPLELADDMSSVIQGRNDIIDKRKMMKN